MKVDERGIDAGKNKWGGLEEDGGEEDGGGVTLTTTHTKKRKKENESVSFLPRKTPQLHPRARLSVKYHFFVK